MGTTVLIALWMGVTSLGVSIPQADIQEQNEVFQRFWGTDFVWKFDDLPVKGGVEDERVPYSGRHLSRQVRRHGLGDAQVRSGVSSADGRWPRRTSSGTRRRFRNPCSQRGGLFGRRTVTRMGTPNWHGHCNGWAAAAIRHAEPKQSVTRNGVVFSPADIKAPAGGTCTSTTMIATCRAPPRTSKRDCFTRW